MFSSTPRSPIKVDVYVMILALKLVLQRFRPPNNNGGDPLIMKLPVHSIGVIVYCCLLIFLIFLSLLCYICDKYIYHSQSWWWPNLSSREEYINMYELQGCNFHSAFITPTSTSRSPYNVVCANLSSPEEYINMYELQGCNFHSAFISPTSTSRSPYNVVYALFLLTSLSRLYLQQSSLPNNNEDGPLMKLLLVHLLKHWHSLDVDEAGSLLMELTFMWCCWCATLPYTYTYINLQDRPSMYLRWVVYSLLIEIRPSVSNNVAVENDEEDQISNEGLKETFDSCSPRSFTLAELALATNYFHQDQILGVGGFGAVYKAVLPNGQTAAVKRVSSTSNQGIKEYIAEVTIVSRSKHRHLVQLIGWCHEKEGEFLLVYELLENKSLDMHLFDPEMVSLPWKVRYKISQGLAKALSYLHEECGEQSVLHRDVKASNVLLDSSFEPKLSDFGLAKLVDYNKSLELSVIAGTKGYLAPECVFTGKVRTQSDVYSYGVVALELVTGRKPIILEVAEDQQVLVEWVQNLYKARRVMKAVDPKLGDDYDKLQVKGLLIVGLWCVLHDFRKRPSMREIVRILYNTHDPLKDLHGKIPSLVPDPVSHDFDSIRPRTRRRFGCF